MKKAWIEINKVRDIAQGNPFELYHKDIAKLYDTDIEDSIVIGAELINGEFVNPIELEYVEPEVIAPEPEVVIFPKVSPMEFKMLFTSAERIILKVLKVSDPIIEDWYEILDDVRLTEIDLNLKSNQDALNYLVNLEVINEYRIGQILNAELV